LGGGRRSRLTTALDFHGRGVGKLLAPFLVRRQTKQLPKDVRKLKEVLERRSMPMTDPTTGRT
jgi:hypothetical protein